MSMTFLSDAISTAKHKEIGILDSIPEAHPGPSTSAWILVIDFTCRISNASGCQRMVKMDSVQGLRGGVLTARRGWRNHPRISYLNHPNPTI
jgi:hypothetical protein